MRHLLVSPLSHLTPYNSQWDEIRFDNHLLGPVPEEGVSRLITQTVSERCVLFLIRTKHLLTHSLSRDHYVRYGIAFLLEHGAYNFAIAIFGF